jgi:uncharacterized protein (TIGR03437 family)
MGKTSAILTVTLAAAAGTVSGQNLMFLREFPLHSNAASMAVDATGIYMPRLTRQDFPNQVVSLLKHDFAGRELWSRPFITAPNAWAGGVTIAPHGIYAVGTGLRDSNAAGDWDIFIARFNTAGVLLWTRQIELPSMDFARSVAADDTGVYVIGQRGPGGLIRKYDASGTEVWTVEMDAAGYHAPLAIATAETGIYVAGFIQPEGLTGPTTGFVRKYDTGGTEIWDQRLGYLARSVATDATGVYVAGWSSPSNFLHKYSTDGKEIWTRSLPDAMSPGIAVDLGLAIDATGIYVAGSTYRTISGQCSQGAQDALLLKFDSNGGELWSRQFGTYEVDSAWAVAAEEAAVYVEGGRLLAKFGKTAPQSDPSRPRITEGCVVNAASLLGGGIAPGEMVTIFGTGLGPEQIVTTPAEGPPVTELAGTRVLFNGVPGALIHVSDKQVSAVTPTSGGVHGLVIDVLVEVRGIASNFVDVPVLPARPGLFTRDGKQAVALNEDGTVNSTANPAAAGSVITLFATGLSEAAETSASFSVSEDDWPVAGEVLSTAVGAIPGMIEVKVRVPQGSTATDALAVWLATRSQPGTINSAPFWSQQLVTVAVR